MKKTTVLIVGLIAGAALLVQSCRTVKRTFEPDSPREIYKKALLDSKLADKPMIREWIQAGDSALYRPVETAIPHKATVTYFKDEPVAYSWKIEMKEGRILHARMSRTDTTHQVFLDLFALDDGEERTRITSAKDSLLHYKSDRTHTVLLRMQPELLVSGSLTLSLTDQPSMDFPVAGAGVGDIKSFWGAPRDGGARRHEGVDIFADRGTPVVAAAEGRVSRTGTSNLGGNIVWLRASGRSLYYAHLDSIIAGQRQRVQVGDTLGLVGNSGNARTTPPHLHFGIYDHGAVNPFPFIDAPSATADNPSVDPSLLGAWGRVQNAKANIRPLPSTQDPPVTSLNRYAAVRILGATGAWYQVELPDKRRGFVHGSLLEPADRPLATVTTASGDSLFEHFSTRHPLLVTAPPADLSTVANYGNKQLVRYRNRLLWMVSSR
ncbi:M23 family metallopeptidase [Fodinibius roseus]|nr:M23 family metallopeptidase [Fodinibius roseus]